MSSLLGGTFAIAVATGLNSDTLFVAALIEETAKLTGVALVLWYIRSRMRGPLDGLVIGFFVGLGFEVVEDALYTFTTGVTGNIGIAVLQVIARTISGFGLHNLWTAIAACGLAAFMLRGRRGAVLGLGCFAIATVLHFLWDLAPWGDNGQIAFYTTTVAVFFVASVGSTRWEKKNFQR